VVPVALVWKAVAVAVEGLPDEGLLSMRLFP
jgi:hypothetical protein